MEGLPVHAIGVGAIKNRSGDLCETIGGKVISLPRGNLALRQGPTRRHGGIPAELSNSVDINILQQL